MSTWAKLPAQRRLYRAFLSHAHADKNFVDELHNWLFQKAKVPIWYDTFSLIASATIATELPNAVSQCRSMIIVLSRASIESGWVKEEYIAAMNQATKYRQYRIIPIRIEDCELPDFLEGRKCIDAFDKKISTKFAFELLTALYYDNQALALENVSDLYISRSWRPREASLPDYVCKLLDKMGFRLIGDSEDQGEYDAKRVQPIIKSCGGLVSIIPNRGNGTPSKYILEEIDFAQEANLPFLIIAETGVDLPENIAQFAFYMSSMDIDKKETAVILQQKIETIGDLGRKPSQPHYTFLATDIDHIYQQRNQIVKQVLQHITAMPCKIGEKIPTKHLRETILEQISNAYLVIADITENNIDVCIEAGIAMGAGRELRLIAHSPHIKTPFTLSNYEVFYYDDDTELLSTIHMISSSLQRKVINSELPR
jgi:TIR domain